MKKIVFITIILFLSQRMWAQEPIISPALVNDLLAVVVTNPKDIFDFRDSPKIRNVIDHFIPWDTLTFEFPKERIPKTRLEREKMLEAEEEPYDEFYLYSPFLTDSIFSNEDRAFILSQSKDANSYRKFSYKAQNIHFVKDSVENKSVIKVKYLGYTYPVFSKNLNYAIIRRYELSWRWNDTTYKTGGYGRDGLQTLYYKRIRGKSWKLIFRSYGFIMS